MRFSLLLPLTLSAALAAGAQQQQSPSQYRLPGENQACPVSLHADRRANVVTREVDGKSIPTGQGLDLRFSSPTLTMTTPQGTTVRQGNRSNSAAWTAG